MAAGGKAAGILGSSLLGYFAGQAGKQRQDDIARKGASLADPWAPMRKHYQGILGKMYGAPPATYEEEAPAEEQRYGEAGKILRRFGMDDEAIEGMGIGGLLGGPGGAITAGLLSNMGGPTADGGAAGGPGGAASAGILAQLLGQR